MGDKQIKGEPLWHICVCSSGILGTQEFALTCAETARAEINSPVLDAAGQALNESAEEIVRE